MSKKLTLSKATISDLDKRGINLVYGGKDNPNEPAPTRIEWTCEELTCLPLTCYITYSLKCGTVTGNPCIAC